MKIENKEFREVVKKMLSYTKPRITMKNFDPKKEGWYNEATWTGEQEEEFKEWMTEYLYNNNEARKSIMTHNKKNKKEIRKAVEEFTNNYGWKIR